MDGLTVRCLVDWTLHPSIIFKQSIIPKHGWGPLGAPRSAGSHPSGPHLVRPALSHGTSKLIPRGNAVLPPLTACLIHPPEHPAISVSSGHCVHSTASGGMTLSTLTTVWRRCGIVLHPHHSMAPRNSPHVVALHHLPCRASSSPTRTTADTRVKEACLRPTRLVATERHTFSAISSACHKR